MTSEEREHIKTRIDQAKRAELQKHRARIEHRKAAARRRSSWQRYYWKHRDEILARRAQRKQAA